MSRFKYLTALAIFALTLIVHVAVLMIFRGGTHVVQDAAMWAVVIPVDAALALVCSYKLAKDPRTPRGPRKD